MTTSDTFATASAKELVNLLAERKISAVELLEDAFVRIEATDGQINAVVVRDFERFKAAGAVILGKTNVPVFLSDGQSYNDIYGTTKTPGT
jgi:Asp-tRNA(Asn)/Glu-tRNA(Gln) amidotransferase A subunit family amidase